MILIYYLVEFSVRSKEDQALEYEVCMLAVLCAALMILFNLLLWGVFLFPYN